jgi:DNA-binding NarL/FixJ family response regulator
MRTLVIVDDHAAFRHAAALVLAHGFRVIGEADGMITGIALVKRLRPDAVLLDVHMPDGDGFEAAAEVLRDPHPPAVVITSDGDPAELEPLAQACGARGFLPKADLNPERLRELVG